MILSYESITSTVALLARLYTLKSLSVPDFLDTPEAAELRSLLNTYAELQFYATTTSQSGESIHNDLGVYVSQNSLLPVIGS